MANEKILNSRSQQKHDIEAHWKLATNFQPFAGEIIVYDAETAETELPEGRVKPIDYPRIKIGDGVNFVNDLPFAYPSLVAVDDGDGNVSLQYEGVETS